MGQALIEATLAAPDLSLAGALDVAGSPLLGVDAGARSAARPACIVGADVDAVRRRAATC